MEYTIEMLELLRHWWVNNIIAQQRGGGGRAHRKKKLLIPIRGDSEITNTMGEGTAYPIGNAESAIE